MSLKEYEYSFEVKSLAPVIEFCKSNNYNFVIQHKQQRTIYRDKQKTYMARITINDKNGVITKQLDFKEDKLIKGQILGERKESLPLDFTDDEAIKSIFQFLELTEDNTLIRNRFVYEKDGVKFELDEYSQPRVAYIVGIEGEKQKVDAVFDEIKNVVEMLF